MVNGAGQKKRRSRFRDYALSSFNMEADKKAAEGKTRTEIKALAVAEVPEEKIPPVPKVTTPEKVVSSQRSADDIETDISDDQVREALNFCFK